MLNRLWNRNIFKKKAQANHFVLVNLNWEVARPRATSAGRHSFLLSLSYAVSIAHAGPSPPTARAAAARASTLTASGRFTTTVVG